jgi:hypothetical protein
MFVYVLKCAAIQVVLWAIDYLRIIPWSGPFGLISMVIVPMILLTIGMVQATRKTIGESLDKQEDTLDRVLTNYDPSGARLNKQ